MDATTAALAIGAIQILIGIASVGRHDGRSTASAKRSPAADILGEFSNRRHDVQV